MTISVIAAIEAAVHRQADGEAEHGIAVNRPGGGVLVVLFGRQQLKELGEQGHPRFIFPNFRPRSPPSSGWG
jgi:hypothetical protein